MVDVERLRKALEAAHTSGTVDVDGRKVDGEAACLQFILDEGSSLLTELERLRLRVNAGHYPNGYAVLERDYSTTKDALTSLRQAAAAVVEEAHRLRDAGAQPFGPFATRLALKFGALASELEGKGT